MFWGRYSGIFCNNNIYKNTNKETYKEEENNKINEELTNKIKFLEKEVNYYKDRIKKLITYYEDALTQIYYKYQNEKNEIIKKKENIKNLYKNEIKEEIINPLNREIKGNNEDIEENFLLFNIDGKDYYKKDLEFINNICHNCNERSEKTIYKCIFCQNYFLCDICKNNQYKKFHDHEDFFEINFPKAVIQKIQNKKNTSSYDITNSFYKILNQIFFDENYKLIYEPFNIIYRKNLLSICKKMKSVNVDPIEYFMDYQDKFIKKEIDKNDENLKILIAKKIATTANNLIEDTE